MNNKKSTLIRLLLVTVLSSFLFGCSHFPGAYTLPIEQGNDLTKTQINKLSKGMNEEQVRFLLGTPLLKDVFHTKRWDYVYYLSEDHKLKDKRHLVVYFDGGKVSDFNETTYVEKV
jgi:outer membrane protein assembly factor BamE